MTEEKVEKGKELLATLSNLNDQKMRWEKAKCIFRIELADRETYNGRQDVFSIQDSFINFEELKMLALAKIDKRIKEVQKEFAEL